MTLQRNAVEQGPTNNVDIEEEKETAAHLRVQVLDLAIAHANKLLALYQLYDLRLL
jgi:hypothetical protein